MKKVLSILAAGVSGLVFAIGLIVSGMANPAKVLAFLDIAGHWDPSLAFVMLGAVLIASLAFALGRRRKQTLLGVALQVPPSSGIDGRLIFGGLMFGVGWGLVGFCPGPALVAIGTGATKALLFGASMLAGMAAYAAVEAWRTRMREDALAVAQTADG
jgi:uncharacterized protein